MNELQVISSVTIVVALLLFVLAYLVRRNGAAYIYTGVGILLISYGLFGIFISLA